MDDETTTKMVTILSSTDYDFANTTNISDISVLKSNSNLTYITLVNVTRDLPFRYAMPLFGYIMPFLLIVTIVANTLIVVVLAQRNMRTATNSVLLAMAISDMLTLLFPAPWYFYMYTLGNHRKILHPPAACYAYHCMIEILPNFFHTASIWLTLLLASQRYVYVCYPMMATTWCALPRVLKAVVWVYVLSLLHQSTRFFDRVYFSVKFFWMGKYHMGCEYKTAKWVSDVVTENVYFTLYYGFRILFVHIGPCATLVVLNVLLFKALKRVQRNRAKLFSSNETRKNECKKQRDSNCTTSMLIVVVTVFLAVEIPLAVTTLLHVMQNALDFHIAEYNDLNATILFTNFFIILSYPVNFAIYCGMSREFRETFKNLFMLGRLTTRREGSSRYSLVNGPRTSTNETIL